STAASNLGFNMVSHLAVQLERVTNSTVSGLDLSWSGAGRSGSGLELSSSSNNTIEHVTVMNRGAGITINGTNILVECSLMLNNNYGLKVVGTSSGIVVIDSNIVGNS